ncbi:hypothetical protein RJ640_003462 [Escallonia rubra]|uniref:Uncharacterized protein n=1 Tax=Escallonia rubra TaxID=112253 RepID=A0AA88QGB5_9ASTE|nr:hypothetical protein RJ640_003462 [Escallonia rubra]
MKYEGVYEWKGRAYDCHELHAESLSFKHPVTGLPVVIQAPLPFLASQRRLAYVEQLIMTMIMNKFED